MNDCIRDIVRALRGFEFSLEEYLSSPDSVLRRAMVHIGDSSLPREQIRDYLAFLFIRGRNQAVEWEPLPHPVFFGDALRCRVKGTEYRPVIRMTGRFMEVLLEKNGGVRRGTRVLPPDTPVLFIDYRPGEVPQLNDYGLRCARELSLELIFGQK